MNSTTDPAWLLDVNALIALLDRDHIHAEMMQSWFAKNSSMGWATCPITENGVIRVISNRAYPGGPYNPAEITNSLRGTIELHANDHHFWADEVSLTDESLFEIANITNPKLVTDAYLLGLAAKHNARLVSFDRTLPWQAIRNGTAKLIEIPLLQ